MNNIKNYPAFTFGLLAFISILVFAAAWAGQSNFLNLGRTYIEAKNVSLPGTGELAGRIPLKELFFFLKWTGIILMLSFVRNIVLTIFGITERPFRKNLAMTSQSVVPMILIGGGIAIVNHLWPIVPAESVSEVGAGQVLRAFITGAIVFAGWLGEGWITVNAYENEFTQPRANAIIIFLAPWLVFALIPLFYWLYGNHRSYG